MVLIHDILISDDVLTADFACNLHACKGACCWEGDFGAPLEEEERATLDLIYSEVCDLLTTEGRAVIEKEGTSVFYPGNGKHGTPLLENGACAFLTFEKNGIARCGIEKAFEEDRIDFKKPISCHLYPVRVEENKESGFVAMNYDRWEICQAACVRGAQEGIPLYAFVREAVERRYGAEFYEEMAAAAEYLRGKADGKGERNV